ncbi:MAG TPA: hypothetical protein VML54_06040 [Candidatus Limnocylindrales bacterium]|nr:hypothetical protein [Candidatus Limnocylindrales bacterium]
MADTRTLTATVEVTTWVAQRVGGDNGGSKLFPEPISPGDTVGDLLRRFSARFPDLDAALWRPGRPEPGGHHKELGEHIEVLVDDAALGVTYDLDSPLLGGERITLLGQFMGGSHASGGGTQGQRRHACRRRHA